MLCVTHRLQRAKEQLLEEGDADNVAILTLVGNWFKYFRNTWMPVVECWSLAGRFAVSEATGIPLDKIPTTNNHVEAFNAVFKAIYLEMYVLLSSGLL